VTRRRRCRKTVQPRIHAAHRAAQEAKLSAVHGPLCTEGERLHSTSQLLCHVHVMCRLRGCYAAIHTRSRCLRQVSENKHPSELRPVRTVRLDAARPFHSRQKPVSDVCSVRALHVSRSHKDLSFSIYTPWSPYQPQVHQVHPCTNPLSRPSRSGHFEH
jgi:hypothetical protein